MSILIRGPRSRTDLFVDTGLSKQTMSEVIKMLETAGWVHAVGATTGKRGRSAILYEIDSRAGVVLGLDIGATRFKMSLTDARGEELANSEIPTASLDAARLVAEIIARAAALLRDASAGRPLRHVCLATPGVVHPATGRPVIAPDLPALEGVDLAAVVGERLGCQVIVENDVNAAIVGERWQGKARNASHAAYVALGTGIGLGIVADGRLLRGATGAAGEVSYLPIGQDSLDPDSRQRGALERSLGIPAVLQDFLRPGGASETIASFKTALDAGAPEALAARNRIGELGALLTLSIQAMIDPEVIVVGGILGGIPPVFDALEAELARRPVSPVNLVRGALGLRATVTGATYLALTGMFNEVFSPQLEPPSLTLPWPVPADTALWDKRTYR